ELHLVRSGRRPVEEIEEEQRSAVAGEVRHGSPLAGRRPNGHVADSVACPHHRGDVTGTPKRAAGVEAVKSTRGASMRRLAVTVLSFAAVAVVPSAQACDCGGCPPTSCGTSSSASPGGG